LPFPTPELAIHKKIREMILKVLVLLPELNNTDFEPTEKRLMTTIESSFGYIVRKKILSTGRLL